MNVTPFATAIVLLGLTSTAGASELTVSSRNGQAVTAWTDGDCAVVREASTRRTTEQAPRCTPGSGAVTLATVGRTRFVADGETGAIRAVNGGETTELFQPFRTRRDVSKRRMVTASVAEGVVTFHITTFIPGGGERSAQVTAVHYNASSLQVVSDRRVEPEIPPTLTYWNAN